jgi:16S rRNA (cytidine1402-2'-O)-methyltransferase
VGLVSDAGTPWLSDPGNIMIKLCHEHELLYTILPGANALVPAVVGAAFPTTQRSFWWFLPTKKWRRTAITTICQSEHPVFVYESVHRIGKLLDQLSDGGFVGQISITRELSKMHEQVVTGSLQEVKQWWDDTTIVHKGEFVIWLSPQS